MLKLVFPIAILLSLEVSTFGANAQGSLTSLYIPGFDPQPLSAVPLGVDAEGKTTYEIRPGSLTGTFSESDFIGTATLVEGRDEASLTYNPPFKPSHGFGYSCSISGVSAICVGVLGTETETFTEDASPITVQIDPAVTSVPTNPGDSPTGPGPSGSSGTPQPGSSSSESAPIATSTSNNGAHVKVAKLMAGSIALATLWLIDMGY